MQIFVALAVATFVAAGILLSRYRTFLGRRRPPGFGPQWRGVRSVLRSSRFWWLAPLATTCMGSFMAIQGLWSVPWLIEVDGYARAVAARHLLVMGITILVGYIGLGLFATRLGRRGIAARHLFVGRVRCEHPRAHADRHACDVRHLAALGALRLGYLGQRTRVHGAQ